MSGSEKEEGSKRDFLSQSIDSSSFSSYAISFTVASRYDFNQAMLSKYGFK